MWMDVAVMIIVLGSATLGYIQGFMKTFLHTAGWILSVILGFVWYPTVVAFLKEKTDFYDALRSGLSEKLATEGGAASGSSEILNGIPDILMQVFQAASDAVMDSLSGGIADILFNIVGFLLVIAVIKCIFWLLISLFSKKNNGGLTGWFDGIFGATFGGVKGIVIVCILLAILVPVTGFASGTFFVDALESSKFTGSLYDNNPLFLIIKGIL